MSHKLARTQRLAPIPTSKLRFVEISYNKIWSAVSVGYVT